MGRTHRVETTFPCLGKPLGYVPKEDILYAVKAIVVVQREHGRRDERRYSRMKYLVNEWGIEKFRSVTEEYYGKKFELFKELPEWEFESYLGWHEQVGTTKITFFFAKILLQQASTCCCALDFAWRLLFCLPWRNSVWSFLEFLQGDGALFCGLHVDNGRIGGKMKKTLREIIQKYNLSVRITPNQNLILCDIRQTWRRPITTALAQAGLLVTDFTHLCAAKCLMLQFS